MSTTGLITIKLNGEKRTLYSQSDSYLECLGVGLVQFLRSPEKVAKFKENYPKLQWVDEKSTPDAEVADYYIKLSKKWKAAYAAVKLLGEPRMRNEWYALLRDFHGVRFFEGVAQEFLKHMWEAEPESKESYHYEVDFNSEFLEIKFGPYHLKHDFNTLAVCFTDPEASLKNWAALLDKKIFTQSKVLICERYPA